MVTVTFYLLGAIFELQSSPPFAAVSYWQLFASLGSSNVTTIIHLAFFHLSHLVQFCGYFVNKQLIFSPAGRQYCRSVFLKYWPSAGNLQSCSVCCTDKVRCSY